jgi:hypothetical protein
VATRGSNPGPVGVQPVEGAPVSKESARLAAPLKYRMYMGRSSLMRERADKRSSFDRPALLTGSAVFVSGFGAVWLMWTIGEHAPELPGLTSYQSATWGDGLLLPIASASLVYAIRRLPPAHREVLWCSAAAVLGALTGAATQVFWLLDPSPRLNWTLPAPHPGLRRSVSPSRS